MASKAIRDCRLTGKRIPFEKKATAIFYFADNLSATEVARMVGISLDSARAIRDREQYLIILVRKQMAEQYYRFFEQDVTAYCNREAARQHQQFWQQIHKKAKTLKQSPEALKQLKKLESELAPRPLSANSPKPRSP